MWLVSLPFSVFLYWLMLRDKKDNPFPKRGIFRLVTAGAVSVLLAVILLIPISFLTSAVRVGVFSDIDIWIQAGKEGSEAVAALAQNAVKDHPPTFLGNCINMFFGAGLLEEGLKYLTCRKAVRKDGMIRTWMDSVCAFAFVGITFELIENIAFGMDSNLVSTIARAAAPVHFAFGVIMGYYYGRYLVSGQKKYRLFSLAIPIFLHTVTNAFALSMDLNSIFYALGVVSGISRFVISVLAVIIVFRWQKNRTLYVPVQN